MFDISWTEFVLIGVVALVVIGPKELPAVMRTMGQYTRKLRSMASEFQNQFQEAMREAEMTDLKKQVDDIAHDIKHTSFDPLKDVRSDFNDMAKDFQTSLESKPESKPATAVSAPETALGPAPVETEVATLPAEAPPPVAEFPLHDAAAELRDENVVGAATGPVAPAQTPEHALPDSTDRTG